MSIFKKKKVKGFTLLELIVVIVIMGILASIAIPTFSGVTKKAQDESTRISVAAMLRDARALVGMQDGTTWETALDTAAGETPIVSYGTSAAGTLTPVKDATREPKITRDEALYRVDNQAANSAGTGTLTLSLRSPSGRVCVGVTTMRSASTPFCASEGTASSLSSGAPTIAAAILSGGVSGVSLPASAVAVAVLPVPSTPASLTSSNVSGSSATVSWAASVASTSPVTGYRVLAVPTTTGTTVTIPDTSATTTSATLTGLTSSTSYEVQVSALSAVGASPAATLNITTPYVAPVFNPAAVSTGNPTRDGMPLSNIIDGNINSYWSTEFSYEVRLPLKSPTFVKTVNVNHGVWGCQSTSACGNGYVYINNGWAVTTYTDLNCTTGARVIGSNTLNGTYPGDAPVYTAGTVVGCVKVSAASTANWLKLREVALT